MPNLDPLSVNERLYRQISELLKQLETKGEKVTIRERYMALASIARIQYIFVSLRKEKVSDVDAGSAVRKYATAFKPHDVGGRKKIARSAGRAQLAKPEPEPDDILDAEFDNDDDDAA